MNIAVIGCGFIAGTHAMVLTEMRDHKLALCIDKNILIAEEFAYKWSVEQYSDNEKLALEPSIDVVHICTPPVSHYDMVRDCLEAGKHVFCEKPLCLEDNQAEELESMAKQCKVVNGVGYNVSYHLPCREITKLVQNPEFGRVHLIHGSYLQEFNALPTPVDWRYDKALAGNMRAVSEIGSHWFDLAQTLSGKKIIAVSATFGNFNPSRYEWDGLMYGREMYGSEMHGARTVQVDSEDAAIVQLRFEDGAIGSVVLSEVSQGRINRLSIEITGENTNIWWDSENNNVMYKGRKNEGVLSNVFPFGNGFADTQRLLFREFYEDVWAGTPSLNPSYPTFNEAARIVRLCNAAYNSANDHSMWVYL